MFVQPFFGDLRCWRQSNLPTQLMSVLIKKNSATVRTIIYLKPLCYNLNQFLVTTINGLGNGLFLLSLKLALTFGLGLGFFVVFNKAFSILT